MDGRCPHISGSYSVHDFFFCFGRGRPLHNVQSWIFCNPIVDLATRSTNSSPVVFPNVWITFLVLSSHSSFGTRSLIPLLHCCGARCLLPSVRSFVVPRTALFLVRVFPMTFPLRCATFGQRAVLILAAFNSFSGPQCFWVQLFLMMFLFHHATFA
jgi:hypothetical protein